MSNLEYRIFYRRHLPHLQLPNSILFITFRLANSLPQSVLQQLFEESCQVEKSLEKISDPAIRSREADLANRRIFAKWDQTLNCCQSGSLYLSDDRIAALVAESLHYRDNKVFALDSYCIMSNHVNIVVKPLLKGDGSYEPISKILHSLKLYTARQANEILCREGTFWQHESYDHLVRDEEEWKRIILYVLNNPVKAGLVKEWRDWKWNYSRIEP